MIDRCKQLNQILTQLLFAIFLSPLQLSEMAVSNLCGCRHLAKIRPALTSVAIFFPFYGIQKCIRNLSCESLFKTRAQGMSHIGNAENMLKLEIKEELAI